MRLLEEEKWPVFRGGGIDTLAALIERIRALVKEKKWFFPSGRIGRRLQMIRVSVIH
jgi:hypothetical protein